MPLVSKFNLISIAILFYALATTASAETITVIGGELGNGNFNANASDKNARLFNDTWHWFNLTSSEFGPTATRLDESNPDTFSGDGTRNALLLKGPVFVNGTGHRVESAGEVFQIQLDLRDATPGWIDNEDAVEVFFFNSKVHVDGKTAEKDIIELGKISFSKVTKDNRFETYSNNEAYTTTANDVGKKIFVGFRARSKSGYARVDNFEFRAVTKSQKPTPTSLKNAPKPFGDILKEGSENWKFVSEFSDEFNNNNIDTKKWNIDTEDWGQWSWEPKHAKQKDGSLHLTMVKDSHERAKQKLDYKSGIARTYKTMTYGYFEAKVKGCSRFPGASPAFWLHSKGPELRYKAKDGETVAYSEIDIIELQQGEMNQKTKKKNSVEVIDCNLHTVLMKEGQRKWFRPNTHPEICKNEFHANWDPREEYHIYAVENSKEWIVWYIDGKEIARKPNRYWHLPMHVTLSLGLRSPFVGYKPNGQALALLNKTTTEGFPTTMSVDYVRVWTKK